MNKLIMLFFFIIFPISSLHCMKRQRDAEVESREAKKMKIQEVLTLSSLPADLKREIVIEQFPKLATHNSFYTICETIQVLSLVSKELNYYINDPCNIHRIINRINVYAKLLPNYQYQASGKYYPLNRYKTAKTISTRGTKNYIQQSDTLYRKVRISCPSIPFSIKELVKMGADVNFQHYEGYCLAIAVKHSHYIYTKELLKYGANIKVIENKDKKALLTHAEHKKDTEMISLLSKR